MANRARAPQGKMARKMTLLSDALGIFSGNIISNQRVLNRDDNLAQAISGGPVWGRATSSREELYTQIQGPYGR